MKWLFLLTGLFLFRIVAQLIVTATEVSFLPPIEHWHSGTMPYGLLLFFQCLILFAMLRTVFLFSNNKIQPNKTLGKILLVFGVMYFVSMSLRFGLGLTVFVESRWFTNFIPTFFHIVLATYVLLVGHFHHRNAL